MVIYILGSNLKLLYLSPFYEKDSFVFTTSLLYHAKLITHSLHCMTEFVNLQMFYEEYSRETTFLDTKRHNKPCVYGKISLQH